MNSEKNWNDLPTELKMMCIGKMDFMTRWNLRATSSSEKQLVHLKKISIEKLTIGIDRYKKPFIKVNSRFRMEKSSKTTISVLACLLNHGKIGKLHTHNDYFSCAHSDVAAEIVSRIPTKNRFKIYSLEIDHLHRSWLRFLQNCIGLKYFTTSCCEGPITLGDFLPALLDVKIADLSYLVDFEGDAITQLIQNWIKNRKYFWSVVVRASDNVLKAVDTICEQFKDRMIFHKIDGYTSSLGLKMNDSRFAIFVEYSSGDKFIQIQSEYY